jgi:hypothetical protein
MVPPQHGAWAFLALPIAVAIPVSPWSPIVLLLAVTWIAAYPASYFLLATVRDRASRHPDPRRFARPLALWWSIAVAGGLILLSLRPWLVWVAFGYAASFVVNLAYARRRDDRALLNDLVFILQCTVMVPVTWAVMAGAQTITPPPLADVPAHVWVLTTAVALVLVGSTLHVKSLIRERAHPAFARASRAFAVLSVAGSLALALWWGLPAGISLVLPYAWFAARSFAMRGPAPRPGRIGLIELVGFLLLVAASAAAQAWSQTGE